MIIINQQKNTIINFQKIKKIYIMESSDYIMKSYNIRAYFGGADDDDIEHLGTYKTKERAEAVLESIITRYQDENCDCDYGMFHEQMVYRMPED